MLFFAAAFLLAIASVPLRSRQTGEVAELTLAIAHQDMPSGIYYDRHFDWPTGEASWIDVPVWTLHLALLFCTVSLATIRYCREGSSNKPDAQNAAIAPRFHSGHQGRGVCDPERSPR